jgi:hypothetical protein
LDRDGAVRAVRGRGDEHHPINWHPRHDRL